MQVCCIFQKDGWRSLSVENLYVFPQLFILPSVALFQGEHSSGGMVLSVDL
jgi:hypothetical protein